MFYYLQWLFLHILVIALNRLFTPQELKGRPSAFHRNAQFLALNTNKKKFPADAITTPKLYGNLKRCETLALALYTVDNGLSSFEL